jgi:hypothetical protein
MGTSTGSSDGTTLTRLFQQNITVLTALDPSGYFAKQYNKILNVFLCTNILPSMYDFSGDAESFSILKEYLETFVSQNINSEDKDIANAATQIRDILAQEDADKFLRDSISMLKEISSATQEALALPLIANKWLLKFNEQYPKWSKAGSVFGGLLINGIAVLSVMNLMSAYKSWDKLTTQQKTQVILNTVQMGLQIVAAIVKRGVRIYAIFQPKGGITAWQRMGAVGRILYEGEAEQLERGLWRISNKTAQWLGDTKGVSIERKEFAVFQEKGALADLSEYELTTTEKILGRNLDEFIATRVGALFLIAGITMSIWGIAAGDKGIELAADIANLASGALFLFSEVGGWLIAGGAIAEEGLMASIIAFAGPLGVLAAFVGVGLMIYQLFKKYPNPIKAFVEKYVKPAGFYVESACKSIDYVMPYDKNGLLMLGFSLCIGQQCLSCNPDGSINLKSSQALPDSVWQVQTDSSGMSQIATITKKDPDKGIQGLLMSLMKDYSITFQPKMSSESTDIITQTWLSAPKGDAKTTDNGKNLVSLPIAFQPVFPDSNGKYRPSNANGWMRHSGAGVNFTQSDIDNVLTLVISGLAPNFMKMKDISFVLNSIPDPVQSFGLGFGILPSTPITYSLVGVLPDFLTFDSKLGKIQPNGKTASTPLNQQFAIEATNSLGHQSVTFNIIVK